MKASVINAEPKHIYQLAHKVRQADIDELMDGFGVNQYEALRVSLSMSTHAWAGMIDDDVVCMFGVSPYSLLGSKGMPWFIGSDAVEEHQMAFLRRNKRYVKKMNKAFPYMLNWVDARNTVAIGWLKWLGFKIYEPKPWGIKGMPFHKFDMGDLCAG